MSLDFFESAPWADDEIIMFDDTVRRTFTDTFPDARLAQWREDGIVAKTGWADMARTGLLGVSIAPEFGGAGGDFRHEAVLIRRLGLIGADGFGVPMHNAICATYIEKFGTLQQKQRLLPKFASGESIAAIAMTEPGAGSDLKGIATMAVPDGAGYRLNGQKTFITNGHNADIVIVVAKTRPESTSSAISLFILETEGLDGFHRGRHLDKVGLDMGDTAELFFNDVALPAEALLGGIEGRGMFQLMEELPKERLIIALECMATIEAALKATVDWVHQRRAFSKRLIDFQNIQFQLAECRAEAEIAKVFVDDCIMRYMNGTLDSTAASIAKYWVSERAQHIVDTCQQMFGGYGYMNEYPIARMYRDVRVKRIYGGTTEIMKVLIARGLQSG